MKRLQFLNNKLLIILILLYLNVVANIVFAVEEKDHSGFSTFAIYTGKTPVYATLSGGFTFYPEKKENKENTSLETETF